MRICGVVLNYRDAARTETCLRSLAGQGLDTVLVVDNSDDEQAAVIERLAGNVNNDAVALPGMCERLAAVLAHDDTVMVVSTVLDATGKRLACVGENPLRLGDAFVRHDGSSLQGQLFNTYHMACAHVVLAMKTWRYPRFRFCWRASASVPGCACVLRGAVCVTETSCRLRLFSWSGGLWIFACPHGKWKI